MKEVHLQISEINTTFQFYAVLDGIDKRELHNGHLAVHDKEVKHLSVRSSINIVESEII